MTRPQLGTFDYCNTPRWPMLAPADAIALVVSAYERDAHRGSVHSAEKYWMALFCAGAPWADVKLAIEPFLRMQLGLCAGEAVGRDYGTTAVHWLDCFALICLTDAYDYYRDVFQQVDRVLTSWWEVGLGEHDAEWFAGLVMYRAALAGSRDLLRIPDTFEPPSYSVFPSVLKRDAVQFCELVDASLEGAIQRARNSIDPEALLLSRRVQGFPDIGNALYTASLRIVGRRLGLAMTAPPTMARFCHFAVPTLAAFLESDPVP